MHFIIIAVGFGLLVATRPIVQKINHKKDQTIEKIKFPRKSKQK